MILKQVATMTSACTGPSMKTAVLAALPLFNFLIHLPTPATAAEIDLQTIPQCAWADCFPYHSSEIGCVAITGDCFCNALAPVNCAAKNCTGEDWYAVEDWLNSQCPNPPNVTLQHMPQCSRSCIREALIPEHCPSQLSRNCFCRLQTVFEGLARCLVDGCGENSTQANETLSSFYRNTCIYRTTFDGSGEEIIYAPKPPDPTPTGPVENLGLIAGLPATFLTLFTFAVGFYKWLARHRAKDGKGLPFADFLDPVPPAPAPPPAYTRHATDRRGTSSRGANGRRENSRRGTSSRGRSGRGQRTPPPDYDS